MLLLFFFFQNLDSKIHHNNLLNNILAKVPFFALHQVDHVVLGHHLKMLFSVTMTQIESNNANVDDAIMLDKDGFVSETNATNIVKIL